MALFCALCSFYAESIQPQQRVALLELVNDIVNLVKVNKYAAMPDEHPFAPYAEDLGYVLT